MKFSTVQTALYSALHRVAWDGSQLCAAMYQLSGGHVVFAPYEQVNSTVHSFRQTKQVATRLTLT